MNNSKVVILLSPLEVLGHVFPNGSTFRGEEYQGDLMLVPDSKETKYGFNKIGVEFIQVSTNTESEFFHKLEVIG